jgi:hypothetical protein
MVVCALILSICAYIVYSWSNLTGTGHPNISSWFVWTFLTVLNFTSYKKATGDWVKTYLPTANSMMCIVTTVVALCTGSFRNLGMTDLVCLCIGIVAGIWWWKSHSAKQAQILVQIAIDVGFIPTFVTVYNHPSAEPWYCWLMWTASFMFQFGAVKLRKGKGIDYLYPTNMVITHAVTTALSLR